MIRNKKLFGYLQLMRPANVVTALSDVLAGIVLAGISLLPVLEGQWENIGLLLLSTAFLYAGGVVMNDVFDYRIDKTERPERPIPSGRVGLRAAALFGMSLLIGGIVIAFFVNKIAFLLATGIAVTALIYNRWSKHHSLIGPVNMGICRGLNLGLGMSILPHFFYSYYYLGLVPVVFIAAITLISRGEVHGGGKKSLLLAMILYLVTATALLAYATAHQNGLLMLLFLLLWLIIILPPLVNAIRVQTGAAIGRAVKSGVLSLIVMNAAWAAAAGSWQSACIILLLLPFSLLLARVFAVT